MPIWDMAWNPTKLTGDQNRAEVLGAREELGIARCRWGRLSIPPGEFGSCRVWWQLRRTLSVGDGSGLGASWKALELYIFSILPGTSTQKLKTCLCHIRLLTTMETVVQPESACAKQKPV